MSDKIIRDVFSNKGGTNFERSEQLAEEVKDAVYRHAGVIPLATAIGILEIVKREVLNEQDNRPTK